MFTASATFLPEARSLQEDEDRRRLLRPKLKGLSRRRADRAAPSSGSVIRYSGLVGQRSKKLSKGMAQKVQFIITVLHRQALLLFRRAFCLGLRPDQRL